MQPSALEVSEITIASAQGIGNSQACLGENAVNDLFSTIVVQRVQCIAPAREVATQELGLAPCRVFLVLGMESLQKKFPLCYESVDSFCILHWMHGWHCHPQ